MKDLIEESISILNNGGDIGGFGELLHEAWEAKRSLRAWGSNSFADDIYGAAIEAGAMGGKLTGAGGGGFMLLFAPPEMQRVIRERFIQLIHVPFKIGFSGGQIIFFDSEEDNSGEEKVRAIRTIESFKKLTQTVI